MQARTAPSGERMPGQRPHSEAKTAPSRSHSIGTAESGGGGGSEAARREQAERTCAFMPRSGNGGVGGADAGGNSGAGGVSVCGDGSAVATHARGRPCGDHRAKMGCVGVVGRGTCAGSHASRGIVFEISAAMILGRRPLSIPHPDSKTTPQDRPLQTSTSCNGRNGHHRVLFPISVHLFRF